MGIARLNDMAGRRLDAVTEARHWYEGRREPDAESLLHAWLYFEYAVPVGFHGIGDQLMLAMEDPYRSYNMYGHETWFAALEVWLATALLDNVRSLHQNG